MSKLPIPTFNLDLWESRMCGCDAKLSHGTIGSQWNASPSLGCPTNLEHNAEIKVMQPPVKGSMKAKA